jgi:acyl dehydratase
VTARHFPVEAGHIMMFARAIGDPNPVYHGAADPESNGSEVIAPPTFVEASIHYDDTFRHRPRIGERWYGSGRTASGADRPTSGAGPATGGTAFHAETHFEYYDVLRPGDLLRVHERPGDRWEKRGARGGRLQFWSQVVDFQKHGATAVRVTTVAVKTDATIDAAGRSGTERSAAVPRGTSAPPEYPVAVPRACDLEVGATREVVLTDDLTRGQILLYAGASGDFSPQHTDEIWNTQVGGYPTVFAHGMLTMGMTARVLTDWFGDGHLRTYGLRFKRQVWPGDALVATVTVDAIGPPAGDGGPVVVELLVSTANGHGEVVASGYATVEVPA